MSWPFLSVLDILEGVWIWGMVVVQASTANGPLVIRLLGLADIQRKLTSSSLGLSLNPLAVSLCSLTAVLCGLFVVGAVEHHSP
jgi:hypothetical protein